MALIREPTFSDCCKSMKWDLNYFLHIVEELSEASSTVLAI